MVVFHAGVQAQEFLRAFLPSEPLLTSFLTSCETVRLFDQIVAAGCGDHLLVVDVGQAWYLSDCGTVAPQLIGVDDLWNVIFIQKPSQEGLRSLGVAVALKKDVEHEAVLVDRSP